MENVILIIHLVLALAIILLVLVQRSEGGGLGIGGSSGGGMGGFASPKGTASALSRMTAILAACFFGTSLLLAILAGAHNNSGGILETYSTVSGEAEDLKVPVTGDEEITGDETNESAITDNEPAPAPEIPEDRPSVPIGD
jgi:preprotein translocase subunit SecG